MKKPRYSKIPHSGGDRQDSVLFGANESLQFLNQTRPGISFRKIDVSTPQGWATGQAFGSWLEKDVGSIKYIKLYDGSVEINAQLQGPAVAIGTTAFILPQSMRPHKKRDFAIRVNNVPALVSVDTAGQVQPYGYAVSGGTDYAYINIRFLPDNNRPDILSCFPIDISSTSKIAPKSVFVVRNQRNGDPIRPSSPAYFVDWSFVQSRSGPVIRINNIIGLEYACKQTVTLMIVEG